jgi:hypothetical protein
MVEAINAEEEATVVDELFASRVARRAKRLFAQFRSAFPDWQEETVRFVAEGIRWRGDSSALALTGASS